MDQSSLDYNTDWSWLIWIGAFPVFIRLHFTNLKEIHEEVHWEKNTLLAVFTWVPAIGFINMLTFADFA